MDLETVQAALAEVERGMKQVKNKIEYRERVVRNTQAEIEGLRLDYGEMVDRYTSLVVRERELKEGA